MDWVVTVAVFGLMAWPFKLLASRYGIRLANRKVEQVAKAVIRGDSLDSDFILYLRPHWLDGRDGYENPKFQILPVHPAFWLHQNRLSLDHFLSLELNTVIISLGTREMRLATGSIQVPDADWETIVSRLIDRSKCVIYVPDITPGMTWELEEIRRQSVEEKVILVQPPELEASISELIRHGESAAKAKPNVEAKWPSIQTHVSATFGLEIADYQKTGNAVPFSENPTASAMEVATLLKKRLRRLSGSVF